MPLPESAISPFGDSAALVDVGGPLDAQALAESIRGHPPAGVTGVVAGLETVVIHFDPLLADLATVREAIASAPAAPRPGTLDRLRTIPVVYGGEHGPDLDDVAGATGLTPADVVELHAATEFRVLFDGFAPGFAYLGDLPEPIRVPRLETPRTRTPRGSVAIAGAMSGIYPADLPGGWRVIGRTPVELFDPQRDPPAYLVPGDHVRFVAIDAGEWDGRTLAQDDW